MHYILVAYYSETAHTEKMARQISRGIDAVDGIEARLRQIPPVSTALEATEPAVPVSGAPYASAEDLRHCDGLILGSPTYYGQMAAAVKHYLDETSDLWMAGTLCGKPAAVFTSTGTQHGGQEVALFGMMTPLLHHGMLITGLPYTESALHDTRTGGSPYGASHLSGTDGEMPLSDDEKTLCRALGKRVAELAVILAFSRSDSD